MAQRISRGPSVALAGPPRPAAWTSPATSPVRAARALPRLHGRAFWARPPRSDLAGEAIPARPPAHPSHRGTGGARAARADASSTHGPPSRRDFDSEGRNRHAPTDRTAACGTPAEIAEGVRVLQSALAHADGAAAPRPLPGRGRHPPPLHDDAAERRGETDCRRSSPGTTTLVAPHRRPRCARTPAAGCSGARSRSATSSAPPPGLRREPNRLREVLGRAGTRWHARPRLPARAQRRHPCRRHGLRRGPARRATNVGRARPPGPPGRPTRAGPPRYSRAQ